MSARPSQEISEEERRYENGSDPKVLDVVTIELERACPHSHQQENHLIDAGYYWVKQRSASWAEIQNAVDEPAGPLWINVSSSYHGLNDRVAEDQLDALGRSLYLVRPENLKLLVQVEGGGDYPSKRRIRAHFSVAGGSYSIAVTDPVVEREYLAKANGEYAIADALICVSLGEVFYGFAYKLAAAIVTPQS